MQIKLISIIIATYNASQTIERCLNSIACQKTEEIELLLIDGSSKDDTTEKIEKYREYIDCFISEPDNGIYDAWNKGIKHSTGEWIMFIGADDQLETQALPSFLDFLSTNSTKDVDIINAKAKVIDNNGNTIYKITNPYRWEKFRKVFNISHGSTLHNRKLFDEVGLFDTSYRICADYELLLRKKLNSLFLDKYILLMQDGGMSTKNEALEEAYRAKRKHKTQSLLGANYRRLRGYIGNSIRQVIPILKRLK